MPPTGPRPYRRRQFLVNRALQMQFVNAMLMVLGVMALAASGALYAAVRMTLSTYELSQDPVLVSMFSTAFWIFVLEMIILTPCVVGIGILLTHRIAGPLVRIRAALKRLSEGEVNLRVTLRKGDALGDLAEDVNRLAESLRRRSRERGA